MVCEVNLQRVAAQVSASPGATLNTQGDLKGGYSR